jgi:hypothetical protein
VWPRYGSSVGVSWGRESPELLIALDRGDPLGRQVQDNLRDAIRDGRLVLGERLPASRALAEQPARNHFRHRHRHRHRRPVRDPSVEPR